MIVDHVAASGMSNSYVTGNNEKIDLSNLEPIQFIARSNTDHDNTLVIEHDGNKYTLDGGATPAIMVKDPIVNATLRVYDPKIMDEHQFSIQFNALCFHPHTLVKTLNGNGDTKRQTILAVKIFIAHLKELLKLLQNHI